MVLLALPPPVALQLQSQIVAIIGVSQCAESALRLTSNADEGKEGMVSNPTTQGANQSEKKAQNLSLISVSLTNAADSAENMSEREQAIKGRRKEKEG